MDKVYYPGRELSLDECMVLWRGRLAFHQDIKNKKKQVWHKTLYAHQPKRHDFKVYDSQVFKRRDDREVEG